MERRSAYVKAMQGYVFINGSSLHICAKSLLGFPFLSTRMYLPNHNPILIPMFRSLLTSRIPDAKLWGQPCITVNPYTSHVYIWCQYIWCQYIWCQYIWCQCIWCQYMHVVSVYMVSVYMVSVYMVSVYTVAI